MLERGEYAIEVIECLCVGLFLPPHFHFEDRGLHGTDSGEPPRRGDQLIDEIPLDGVGRGKCVVVTEAELFEFVDAFIRKKDDGLPPRLCRFAFWADFAFPSGVICLAIWRR